MKKSTRSIIPKCFYLPYATFLFTSGNAASHGFSMFLYSALLPNIKEHFHLSYTSASLISAIFLISYMGMSVISGILLVRLKARSVLILAICICPPLIALAALSPNAYGFTICLSIVSGSAVTHWNAIVDYATENIPSSSRNKVLGLSSSGGAFAICINGILISLLMPNTSIPTFFILCASITLIISVLTYFTLPKLELNTNIQRIAHQPSSLMTLFKTLSRNKLSLLIFVFCLLIGLYAGPYTNFLSLFILEKVNGNPSQTGDVWFLIGVSGILGGLFFGKISDRVDIIPSLQMFFAIFSASILYLIMAPSIIAAYLSAIIFGFLYFPTWGLIASYVSRYTDNKTSALIISIGMVGYGIGNAFSSMAWGSILDYLSSQHSSIAYQMVYAWVLAVSIMCIIHLKHIQGCLTTPNDSSSFSAKKTENGLSNTGE